MKPAKLRALAPKSPGFQAFKPPKPAKQPVVFNIHRCSGVLVAAPLGDVGFNVYRRSDVWVATLPGGGEKRSPATTRRVVAGQEENWRNGSVAPSQRADRRVTKEAAPCSSGVVKPWRRDARRKVPRFPACDAL